MEVLGSGNPDDFEVVAGIKKGKIEITEKKGRAHLDASASGVDSPGGLLLVLYCRIPQRQ